jgi:hypothetical protein
MGLAWFGLAQEVKHRTYLCFQATTPLRLLFFCDRELSVSARSGRIREEGHDLLRDGILLDCQSFIGYQPKLVQGGKGTEALRSVQKMLM